MKRKINSRLGISTIIIVLIAAVLLAAPDAKAFFAGTFGPAVIPSVIFKDGAGKTIDISKQRGKVLFINFWATWCPPCIAEMPSINKLKAELNSKDILFLMVDVDANYKKSSRFMSNRKYDLQVYTPASEIPQEFLSGAIPTTVIIDKSGRVAGRHQGGADYSRPEVIKFFKDLLNKK